MADSTPTSAPPPTTVPTAGATSVPTAGSTASPVTPTIAATSAAPSPAASLVATGTALATATPSTASTAAAPLTTTPNAPLAAAATAAPIAPSPSPVAATDWPTYNQNNLRTGISSSTGAFSTVSPGWQSDVLDGEIYAQPLVVNGHVLVATANNTVYSLDARSGKVVWQDHVGEPVSRSQLPCGDIGSTGIIGTPVVDVSRGLVDFSAFVQPGQHQLVGLDLTTGAVRFRQNINFPGADPLAEQQRTALALVQNNVYIGFGGLYGDCGNYHGWMFAANAADGTIRSSYQVPTQREGAIWSPGAPVVDAAGNVYAATGNGSSENSSNFDYGDAVLRLSPELHLLDWFAPANWVELNQQDLDIGSIDPTLLANGLLFQIGKSGVGYLLQANHLGHINGQLYDAPVCGGAYGANAYSAPTIFVPCRDGLVAVQVANPPSFSVHWRLPGTFAGPPIVAGGAVWSIGRDGTMYVLDPANGQVRFSLAVGTPTHFASPSASGQTVYVPSADRITAYSLH